MNNKFFLSFVFLFLGGIALMGLAFVYPSKVNNFLTASLQFTPPTCPFHVGLTPNQVKTSSELSLRQEAILLKLFFTQAVLDSRGVAICKETDSLNTCLARFQNLCYQQGKCQEQYDGSTDATITSEIRAYLCTIWSQRYTKIFDSWTKVTVLFAQKNTSVPTWLSSSRSSYLAWKSQQNITGGASGGTGGEAGGGTGVSGGGGTGTITAFTPESCAAYGKSMGVGNIYSCQFAENCASTLVAGPCPIGGRLYFCCLSQATKCSDFAKQGYACVSPYLGIRENCQPGTQLPGVICNAEYQVVCCKPKSATKCVAVTTLAGYCGGKPTYNRDWKCVPAGPGEKDDGCDIDLINPCRVKYGTYSGVCPSESCVTASECKGLINNLYGCLDANQVCCNYAIESIPITLTNICDHYCLKSCPNGYEQLIDKKCHDSGYICCKKTESLPPSTGCNYSSDCGQCEKCVANQCVGVGCILPQVCDNDHGCKNQGTPPPKCTGYCVSPGTCSGNILQGTCSGNLVCCSSNALKTICYYLTCENGTCVTKTAENENCPHNDEGGCTSLGSLCGKDYCIKHASQGYGCTQANKCLPDTEIVAEGCEGSLVCCKPCVSNCENKDCGNDGCGGSCGSCPNSKPNCINGQCSVIFQ